MFFFNHVVDLSSFETDNFLFIFGCLFSFYSTTNYTMQKHTKCKRLPISFAVNY